MILTYHKIHPENKTIWWVTPDSFYRQMADLRSKKVVYLDDYDPADPTQAVITFDGVYKDVWTYAVPILQHFGYPFELFVIGQTIGKDNSFDAVEPHAEFADIETLQKMVTAGGRLQWHSWSHARLAGTTNPAVYEKELTIPDNLRQLCPAGFKWYAYPHGERDGVYRAQVESRFTGALACDDGNNADRYDLNRLTIYDDTRISKSTVSLIIPCYNYGHLAAEAVESALLQTYPPDEILFIDDASSDNSVEVARRYEPRIRVEVNEKNLGVVENFRKAVEMTSGDYIVFLGADNRFRSDYVEQCKTILDANPDVGIVYTHFALFGDRAAVESARVGAEAHPNAPGVFIQRFPANPTHNIREGNYIHGSSMYRRIAYQQAGGYRSDTLPEDHSIFARMLDAGWKAMLWDASALEYRQHSKDQINHLKMYEMENAYLRSNFIPVQLENARLNDAYAQIAAENARLYEDLQAILASRAWKIVSFARRVYRKLTPPGSAQEKVTTYLFSLLVSIARRAITFIGALKGLPRRIYSKLKLFRYVFTYPGGIFALLQKAVFMWRLGGWQNLWSKSMGYIRWQANQPIETSQSFYGLRFAQILASIPPAQKGVIFVSHNASATGAPINLLNQCKAYRELHGNNFVIVVISGGELIKEFQTVGVTIDLHRIASNIVVDENVETVFSRLRHLGYSRCIANTVVSGCLSEVFKKNHLDVIYEIHELPRSIEMGGWINYAKNIASSGATVIFAANFVAQKFISSFGLPADLVKLIPQGIRAETIYQSTRQSAKTKLLDQLRLPEHQDIKIVLGAGLAAHMPKGTDLFFDVAEVMHSQGELGDIHFVWLGNRDDYFEHWKKHALPKLPYREHIHFLDFEANPAYVFAGADIFLLTSREDAFPSVALESLANNTPVVAFAETSGIQEILNETNGAIVGHLDIHEMAHAVLRILSNIDNMRPAATQMNSFADFVEASISLFQKTDDDFQQRHKVTVVVPNYNYEQYLPQRLESIIQQTYPPSEILFLDDGSSDKSVAIAEEILKASGIPCKIIVNQQNQGVFRQWLRGIQEANCDFLWIAEADDFADKDFLAQLMPAFAEADVNIAYCQPIWVDERSQPYHDYTYQDYMRDLSPTRWLSNYVESGQYEVSHYLGVRNTIPNVSGVVFRKQALQGLDETFLLQFRYAGDWYVYLQALRSGQLFYSAKPMNFHRRHRRSTIADANGNAPFFAEARNIYQYIAENFHINANTIVKMERNLSAEKNAGQVAEQNRQFFDDLKAKVLSSIQQRERLKILIILSEFKIGGGEITGLRLANYLARTHEVYLYAAKKDSSPSFLAMISPSVQVIQEEDALIHLIHTQNLDFVNSHIWWGDKFTYSLLKDNNIYWILSMHGCYEMLVENPQVDPDFQALYKPIIERANHITYDTKRNLRILDYLHNPAAFSKTRQIYHGYERKMPEQKITHEMLGLKPDTFVFVFAGRGIREKGWEEAIQSALTLRKDGLNLVLLMFGDSDYVQDLKKRYWEDDVVRFMGETSNLAGYLAIADCGILPTYFVSESQPLTVIEFLAAGLPVISTDIGEIKTMLEMGDISAGIALPLVGGKVSESLLRDAMRKLLQDRQQWQKLKDAAIPIFNAKFDIGQFAHAYLSLYTCQEQDSTYKKAEKP